MSVRRSLGASLPGDAAALADISCQPLSPGAAPPTGTTHPLPGSEPRVPRPLPPPHTRRCAYSTDLSQGTPHPESSSLSQVLVRVILPSPVFPWVALIIFILARVFIIDVLSTHGVWSSMKVHPLDLFFLFLPPCLSALLVKCAQPQLCVGFQIILVHTHNIHTSSNPNCHCTLRCSLFLDRFSLELFCDVSLCSSSRHPTTQ